MARAYLSLGGNMGDREKNLNEALNMLESNPFIKVTEKSSIYETEPVGYIDQDIFLNRVIEIETDLEPNELLDFCQSIEQFLGRERLIRWGPRTIDIDILLYDELKCFDKKLTIPHPHMKEREFVMIPLAEIRPDMMLDGETVNDIIKDMNPGKVQKR